MLVRLIYASRARGTVTQEWIDSILDAANRHNPADGITGVLCYGQDFFLQALEGSREQVNRLYARLQRDERHTDLTLLDYAQIGARQYTGWSMGKLQLDRINRSILLKYSPSPTFDPHTLCGGSIVALLEELTASAVITCGGRD